MSTAPSAVPAAETTRHSARALREKALRSLARRMTGYTLREVKTTYEYDADGNRRVKSETVVRKQVGPDLAAITFALTNLDPQRWRPKSDPVRDPAARDGDAAPDLSQLSEEALREIADSGDG